MAGNEGKNLQLQLKNIPEGNIQTSDFEEVKNLGKTLVKLPAAS